MTLKEWPTEETIRESLRTRLAVLLKCAPADIDVNAPIGNLGLDSATAVGLTLELEEWLDRPIDPALFFEHPTIQALAAALANLGAGASDQEPPPGA